MDSLIEFYFRLISYINANWKKYIDLFKKMSTFEKIIQCFLFVIEISIVFYVTVEVVKDTDSIMPFVSFALLLIVFLVHQYFYRETKVKIETRNIK